MSDPNDKTDEKTPDDKPETRHEDGPATGRQKYPSARPPGDYTEDFGTDGTIDHPVKGDG